MAKKGKPFIKEPEQLSIVPVSQITLRLTGAGSFYASYLRQKVLKGESLTVNEEIAEKLIKTGEFEEIF